RERIREISSGVDVVETNAIQGTGLRYLVRAIAEGPEISNQKTITLKGIPPLGVCTVCIGKTGIGWQNHFGVIRKLDGADYLFRGE
ncbi:MAG: cobalamin biosynthesis protein, partial [Methanobacteriota archaeon]